MSRYQQFLDEYPNPNTRNAYRYALRQFFKTVYGAGNVVDQVERYCTEERDYGGDVKDFLKSLNGRPPKSVTMVLAAVKSFLVEQDVELPQKFWRRLRKRIKGSRARTVDKVPSTEGFRRLLLHMNIQGKALFLVLASSGMRIGEALKIHLDDVDLDAEPACLVLRDEYTKTGFKGREKYQVFPFFFPCFVRGGSVRLNRRYIVQSLS
jgi:integrase